MSKNTWNVGCYLILKNPARGGSTPGRSGVTPLMQGVKRKREDDEDSEPEPEDDVK